MKVEVVTHRAIALVSLCQSFLCAGLQIVAQGIIRFGLDWPRQSQFFRTNALPVPGNFLPLIMARGILQDWLATLYRQYDQIATKLLPTAAAITIKPKLVPPISQPAVVKRGAKVNLLE